MYTWRKLTEKQREQILASRQKNLRPWHSPPHFESVGQQNFHLSAACYEHLSIMGTTPFRIEKFESQLIRMFSTCGRTIHAWCILPNHWHALIRTGDLKGTIKEVGQLHGKTSFLWNQEDDARGRKCWHGCVDRRVRSDRHFHVARNYIHHNPVKHGYAETWEMWPYSSALDYISKVGRDVVVEEWNKYPLLEMGNGWDD